MINGDGFLMKAMHLLGSLLTASVLFGCGGSGATAATETSAPPAAPVNAAPVISGVSSTTLLAMQPQSVELSLSDADGDALTISVTGADEWAAIQLSEDTALVNLTPGFFDIGEHTLSVAISDGQNSTVHEISVVVVDNPDAYQHIELSAGNLAGHWTFDDGSELHLYDDKRGLYRNNLQADYFPVTWNIPEANKAHIVVQQQACGTCWRPHDAFALEIVAQENNQIRARFTEGEELRSIANGIATETGASSISPESNSDASRQFYTYLGGVSGNRASYFDSELGRFTLVTPVPGLSSLDNNWPIAILSGTFSSQNNGYEFTPDASANALTDIFKRFVHAQSGSLDGFYMDFVLDSLEQSFTSSSLHLYKAVLKPQLDSRHENVVLDDYPEMSQYLAQELTVWVELQPLTPVENLDFQTGQSYYSVFQHESQFEFAGRTFDRFNANQLELESDSKGRFIIGSAHDPDITTTIDVDIALSGNVMQISQGETSHRYGFYRNVNGELVNMWLDGNNEMVVVAMKEADPVAQETPMTDLAGFFLHINGRSIHEQNERYFTYSPATDTAGYNRDMYISNEPGDNSLLMSMSFGFNIQFFCDGLSYNYCLAQEQSHFFETAERPFVMRRMKLIKVEGNRYFFQNNSTFFFGGLLLTNGQLMEMVRLDS